MGSLREILMLPPFPAQRGRERRGRQRQHACSAGLAEEARKLDSGPPAAGTHSSAIMVAHDPVTHGGIGKGALGMLAAELEELGAPPCGSELVTRLGLGESGCHSLWHQVRHQGHVTRPWLQTPAVSCELFCHLPPGNVSPLVLVSID